MNGRRDSGSVPPTPFLARQQAMRVSELAGARRQVFSASVLLSVGLLFLPACTPAPVAEQAPEPEGFEARTTVGDGGVSDFYSYAEALLELPGVLLRKEAHQPDLVLPGAAEGWRVLYSSTDGLDATSRVAVSGSLFLPAGPVPDGGWPLLLWSHGTVGIADVCAPSWTGYVPFHREHLQQWLESGYAVVASDYQGLGTPGTHPYLATRPAAFSNLDAVRAVQGEFPVSEVVVVAGQSQGAGAAIATAGYAPEYAPELDLRAVVATGVPYFTPEALLAVQEARPPDRVDPMLAYNFLVLSLIELVDPAFDAGDYVHEEVLPTARAVSSVCNRDMRARIQEQGLTYSQTFKRSLAEEFDRVFERMQFPTLNLKVPLFVGVGALDRDTPPRMQARFVEAACQAGSGVLAVVYPGEDHLSVLNRSLRESVPFAQTARLGVEVPNNCDALPFSPAAN